MRAIPLPLEGEMHELSLMESVVAAVVERVGLARVTTVRLEVGRLSAVVPEALRFCFDVCARGTALEGARLEIREIPGRARCRSCGVERSIGSYAEICECGGTDLRVVAGEELRVKNVEVT
jgi:hydrogenase nickel incorporation protein HypA/HybF